MKTTTLADALPQEIARVQAKRERWLGYQREMGSAGGGFGMGLHLMQAAIGEGVAALASGDVVRMLRAHSALADFDSDD